MTPKAKDTAKDIYVKMLETIPDDVVQDKETACKLAKLHALICVDKIIKLPVYFQDYEYGEKDESHLEFWEEVKQEIQKL